VSLKRKVVLTVAGFDNSGGGGVLADVRTFNHFGLHGVVALTGIAVQNTCEVKKVIPLSPEDFRLQLEVLFGDFSISGIKTGMLTSAAHVKVLAEVLLERETGPLVVDPVFRSKSGARLLEEEGIEVMRERILPLTTVFTPNTEEAEVFCGFRIRDLPSMERCAGRLIELGVRSVLLKGGHLEGKEAIDVFYDGKEYLLLRSERLERSPRGTGCVLSSVILSLLVLGYTPREAVRKAKKFITEAIKRSEFLGRCYPIMLF